MTEEAPRDPGGQGWSAGAEPLTRRLNRLTERLRAYDRRRPLVWDLLLTGLWLAAAAVDAAGGWRNIAFNQDVPVALVVAMSLGFCVPLLWRRTRPLTTLLVMLPFALANAWTGAHLQASLLQLVAIFHIALRLPLRTLTWSCAIVAVPVAVGATRYPVGSWDQQFVPAMYGFAFLALLGLAVRTRKEYTSSLVERARQLEVERDQQAQLAAAAERTRIAREMHDIIGHNLSVITGLADGGSYAAAQHPERAAQALEAIGTTSRQALSELRRLLGVLREQSPDAVASRDPQPTLDSLEALIDGVRGAGLPVRLTIHGSRPALSPSPGRQLTVYRVVQEALTNALKHAGTDTVTADVTLTYGRKSLDALITNTGTRIHPPPDGQGITGMRERTALYDGRLDAGPLPAGGWAVRLRIPLEDTPS
ncbi:histidine kinase [Streptomyces sp. NPDC000410]|uniref:sensor histidine kinase n=1 Tax=Streptomyces sp. NPDC000410 TaxID=3154254 RepID=UPI00332BB656